MLTLNNIPAIINSLSLQPTSLAFFVFNAREQGLIA